MAAEDYLPFCPWDYYPEDYEHDDRCLCGGAIQRNSKHLLYGTCLAETEKAWLFELDNDGRQHWFPKSRCSIGDWGGRTYVSAPGWLLYEKGINFDGN